MVASLGGNDAGGVLLRSAWRKRSARAVRTAATLSRIASSRPVKKSSKSGVRISLAPGNGRDIAPADGCS
jgi:hypothetical protein